MTIAISRMRTIAHGQALIMLSRKLTTNNLSRVMPEPSSPALQSYHGAAAHVNSWPFRLLTEF
jgi:hypothetical protein